MRKIQFVTLVVASLVLLASTAFAFGEIRYTDRPLNLRDGRSPKARWVGNMYPGQKVRIDHLKDGWVAVFEPDALDGRDSAAVGFANVKYLQKKRTRYEPKEWGELQYAIRAINVRTKPSVKGKRIMTLKSWEHVLVDFPEGDWIMVFKPNATIRSEMNGIGYSSAKYFRPATEKTMAGVGFKKHKDTEEVGAGPEVVTSEPSPADKAEAVSGEGQVSGAVAPPPAKPAFVPPRLVRAIKKINVRAAKTSGSSLVRTLEAGDRVKVGRSNHGWYEIYGEYERVHALSQPMGYALQTLVDKASKPAVAMPESKPVAVSEPEPAVAEPKPLPVAAASEPEPVSEAEPALEPEAVSAPKVPAAPAKTSAPKVTISDKGQQTMVIDRAAFAGKKRPDPTPNKTAHGYQYRFLEKSETRQLGEVWVTLKVFLSTTKLPARQGLEDFATSLWKEHRRVTKKVAVLIYLPGMDTEDLAYGVIKFDDNKLLELWVRKATLFGTKFL